MVITTGGDPHVIGGPEVAAQAIGYSILKGMAR